jgi:hypothetical protein
MRAALNIRQIDLIPHVDITVFRKQLLHRHDIAWGFLEMTDVTG